jgi:hypothetical protein
MHQEQGQQAAGSNQTNDRQETSLERLSIKRERLSPERT